MFDPDISTSRTNTTTLEREPAKDQIRDPQELARVNSEFERNFRDVSREFNPTARESIPAVDPRQIELAKQLELRKLQAQEVEAARAREERQRVFEQEARELAEKNAKANFKDKNFTKQFEQDLQALKDKHGMNAEEVKAVATQYMSTFRARSDSLFNELPWYKQAYYNAKESLSNTYDAVTGIADRIGGALPGSLQNIYNVTKAVRLTAETVVSGALKVGETIGGIVESGVQIVSDPKTWQAIGEKVSSAWDSTVSGIKSAASYVAGVGEKVWTAVSSIAQSVGSYVHDKAVALGTSTWEAIKNPENWKAALLSPITTAEKLGRFAFDMATSPEKRAAFVVSAIGVATTAYSAVTSAYSTASRWAGQALDAAASLGKSIVDTVVEYGPKVGHFISDLAVSAGKACYQFGKDLVNDPIGTLKSVGSATWGFVKGLSDSLGITDIVVGCGSLIKGVYEVVSLAPKALIDLVKVGTGRMSPEQFRDQTLNNAKEAFGDIAKGGQAIVGGIKLMGEVTGISDAVRCVGCLIQGDWQGAAINGAFALMSIGSIAATVATAGAAGATVLGVMGLKTMAQQGLKTVVKEGMQVAAKELGERAARSLTKEVLEVAGEKAAKATVQELNKELAVIAARKGLGELTPEIAKQLTKDIAEKHVSSIVKDLTEKAVKNVGEEWAQAAVHKPGKFIKMCEEMGIEKSVAKDMQKAMAKGRCDKEIKEILCKEMEEPLVKRFREGMKDSFEKNLDEGIEKLQKKYGLGDDVADGMKAGGREGFESGIRKGVREGLKKAWDDIFDDLRKKKIHLGMGSGGAAVEAGTLEEQINAIKRPDLMVTSSKDESTKFAQTGKAVEIRSGLDASGPGAENDGKVLSSSGRNLMAEALNAMEAVSKAKEKADKGQL